MRYCEKCGTKVTVIINVGARVEELAEKHVLEPACTIVTEHVLALMDNFE